MDYKKQNEKFKDLFNQLTKLAKNDGIITESEEQVLSTVKMTIEMYENTLIKAVEDGIITEDEQLQLLNVEDKLLESTFELVEKDEKLDKDSKHLVQLLFDTLMNILK